MDNKSMWSDEFIKNEIKNLSESAKNEIKAEFSSTSRSDFEPPQEIELIIPCNGKAMLDDPSSKIGYSVNFKEPNIMTSGTFADAA